MSIVHKLNINAHLSLILQMIQDQCWGVEGWGVALRRGIGALVGENLDVT